MKRRSLCLVAVVVAFAAMSLLAAPARRRWETMRVNWLIHESKELARKRATEQEVRRVLGDPGSNGIFQRDGAYSFVYDCPRVDSRFVCAVGLELSSTTHRVRSLTIGNP
jgi:hypothetical protein